ncbi:MAG: two-component system response regulator [Geobacteraceae bacterium GWC2_53_11]|nr:MAG: two-component system response regulator [Geobacteraceae bacterium GWC2_53_11]
MPVHSILNDLEQSILIVDDDAAFLDGARRALLAHGMGNVTLVQDSSQVLQTLATGTYNVVLLDWVMPHPSGADLLPEIVRHYPDIPVIIMSGVRDLENVVSCIKQGAYDYITKPLDTTRLVSIVQNAAKSSELDARNRKLTGYLLGEPLSNPENFSDIITCNERMMSVFKVIETLARSSQPVLITGETGVGKELIAHAIHKSSGLNGRMVTVNAAGLDDTMLADTLFGHKKGAFTGATESRGGLIEQAKGGTLLLDEIGDLSNASQIKLLRLLQQNEYYRLGSDVLHKSDARILAASNANFPALLAAGTFRSDLYYRIKAHALHIPPLRDRPEDIIPLVQHYVAQTAQSLRRKPPELSPGLRQALASYRFPGNVRELINMVHDAVTHNRKRMLAMDDFPGVTLDAAPSRNAVRKISSNQFALHAIFPNFPSLDEVQTMLIEGAFRLSGGNRTNTAKMVGLSRQTLLRKLEAMGVKHADGEEP